MGDNLTMLPPLDSTHKFKGRSLIGKRFNRLTVTKYAGIHRPEKGSTRDYWLCQCDCGGSKIVRGDGLATGDVSSCGCAHKFPRKHGLASEDNLHHLYRTWTAMRHRCSNPNATGYEFYGGRGIKVCERWSEFTNFLSDMLPTWKKGLTLDRYPDNDGNYEPGNCRWATRAEQNSNTRANRKITFEGQTKTTTEWALIRGIRPGLISDRIDKLGWSVNRAIGVLKGKYGKFIVPGREIRII